MIRNHYTMVNEKTELTALVIVVFIVGVFVGVAIACTVVISSARAEELGERWVLCQPDSYVNIRETPNKAGAEGGRLILGDRVETDGKKRNGFLHIINAGTETGDGWVAARYLVEDKPVIGNWEYTITGRGRVAVRQYPGGKRTRWVKPGDAVTVYAISAEWSVTNKGFICSDFID